LHGTKGLKACSLPVLFADLPGLFVLITLWEDRFTLGFRILLFLLGDLFFIGRILRLVSRLWRFARSALP
jgi:hypothetical protein